MALHVERTNSPTTLHITPFCGTFFFHFNGLTLRHVEQMKIQSYRELDRKSVLLPLMEQAFGWPFDPIEFEKTIKMDPRLKESCVGFCALEGDKAVGFVGTMDLATRLVDGTSQNTGGVYGVATLPGHTRKGICTKLMNCAHEYFQERGYRFSFLTTSPTIVAYGLYKKLGYFDVTSFPGVYKVKERTAKRKALEEKKAPLNFGRMLDIYRNYMKDKVGLVLRDMAYMKALTKFNDIRSGECIMTSRGYAIFKKDQKQVRIRELIASEKQEMRRLIEAVEEKAQDVVYGRAVLDTSLKQVYESLGFTVLESGHGVLMVKELANTSFSKAYGDKFFMTALDHF
jgi:ribosomal protein S18 acetylase RimI-like enzyme